MKPLNRFAFWFVAVVLIFKATLTIAAPLTARIRDTDYVRVAEWARWQGLQTRWVKRDETFLLTNAAAKIQFEVSSREARYNGVQLWLLHPLVSRGDEMYISKLDIDFTFRPLLAAPRNDPGKRVRVVCLDAGHGGKDPGNRAFGRQEKDLVMKLSTELRGQLERAGFKVVFTRTSDRFIELTERADIARKRGADVFVSLHFNGASSAEARGSEVFAMTPVGAASTNARGEGAGSGAYPGNRNNSKNLLLAYQIQKSLVRTLGSEDRGVRRARFEVLREATMPAALIEAGFLSNPVEGRKIFTEEYRRQMARAITEGIVSYKRVMER
jgi:N-acetylmuramoyl-L-alanine amidase